MRVFNDVVKPFIPEAAVNIISEWAAVYPLQIRISKARATKLGDYRPPTSQQKFHKISINRNLNKYAFLITFTHEYAHLLCFEKYKTCVKPHGNPWKEIYKSLLFKLLESKIFPPEIEFQLTKIILGNVFASSTSEKELSKTLHIFNTEPEPGLLLEDLTDDTLFRIHNGFVFQKGKKIRTRYKCYCVSNRRWYYVSPIVRVIPVGNEPQANKQK
ncbi:MAG: SprT-like domain-containing protein [Bacteroidota bacterium]